MSCSMELLNAESKVKYTMLEDMPPRPMQEKTVNTSIALLPIGVFSAESDEDMG
jgi:hypothetical protein